MAGLSEAAKKFMQKKQAEVKEKMASGTFTKSWTLNGKNAIVEQGGEVVVRFGPHWSVAIMKDGKLVPNPEYVSGDEPIFVPAIEHWWDADGGKVMHAWCPKTADEGIECPICVAAKVALSSSNEDEKKYGKRIQAKEVFIFNAVVGNPRKTADGKADFRIMAVPGTVYNQVTDIMTGGSDESFARGNIGDHKEGYDIKLSRPAKSGNDRWKVDCSPKPSPLFDAKQAAQFNGWPGMLVDLDKMLKDEMKTPLELFKAFYGRDPEPDEMNDAMRAEVTAKKQMDDQVAAEQGEAPEAQPDAESETAQAPDMADEFMVPSPAQAPKAGAPQPPKVAGPKTGGRR
jgi:hypothetical protein